MLLTILTATAFVHNVPNSTPISIALFTFAWIAQFAGHGLAEGRAPALLDNLMGGTSTTLLSSQQLPLTT